MEGQQRAALAALNFGEVDSESEDDLALRFLATREFSEFASGKRVDLVLGPKGSGKSAMFQMFARHQNHARNITGSVLRQTIIATGTGFRDLSELSTSEIESLRVDPSFDFERLWTLYIALKAAIAIGREGIESKGHLREFLRQKNLSHDFRLLPVLKGFWRAVMSGSPPETFKVTIQGKTVEIGTAKVTLDIMDLLGEVDDLLKAKGKRLWLLFDNLDELYASDPKTRTAALNALFATVNQLRGRFSNIHAKVLLRTDLWSGLAFNNKSHWVGKELCLAWTEEDLVALLVKRALLDESVAGVLSAVVPKVATIPRLDGVSPAEQRALIYGIFERGVHEDGSGDALSWMLARCTDSRSSALPREVITFANQAVRAQRKVGTMPEIGLISGQALRAAYPEVSRIRYETFLSEFPELQHHFKRFRGRSNARFHRGELIRLMQNLKPSDDQMIEALYEVGVVTPVDGDVTTATVFDVPLLYRPGLGLR